MEWFEKFIPEPWASEARSFLIGLAILGGFILFAGWLMLATLLLENGHFISAIALVVPLVAFLLGKVATYP